MVLTLNNGDFVRRTGRFLKDAPDPWMNKLRGEVFQIFLITRSQIILRNLEPGENPREKLFTLPRRYFVRRFFSVFLFRLPSGDLENALRNIVTQRADPKLDMVSVVFGDNDAYESIIDAYMMEEVKQLDEPVEGALAIFTDEDENIRHIGKVIKNAEGNLVILSKVAKVPYTVQHPLDMSPDTSVVRILFVQSLKDE